MKSEGMRRELLGARVAKAKEEEWRRAGSVKD